MAQILKVLMQHSKSTKGTHRYDTMNSTDAKLLTCVYINKETLTNPPPQWIYLTVEDDPEAKK